jgi:EmrB/QacA subfamily drug resistance transporter
MDTGTTTGTVVDPLEVIVEPNAPSFLATARGKLVLLVLCAVAFLDFVDGSIVNVALPDIRADLNFSVQGLQWVPSGYLLTYGGFMLFGGRLADLLGRRRILLTGTLIVGVSSVLGGFAGDAGMLVTARMAQGLGAAFMLPAALSILTTTFTVATDRHRALGVWGGVAGLASAIGVFLGGILTEGPGWRWVMFVNPIACALVIPAVLRLIEPTRARTRARGFDAVGTVLVTAGMLLLVFALVKAPEQGWSAASTVAELIGAAVILALFVVNEALHRSPLMALSIFRVRGLVAADVTQLIAFAGFLAVFFFLTLYMQNVLGYSPLQTGAAYLPLCAGVAVSAAVGAQLISRVGTRPLIIIGSLIAAGGVYYLSRIPVDGSYAADILPGTLIMSAGLGPAFVAVATAANAGVAADKAGLAAALLNASQQVGGALGLAIFSAISTARAQDLLHSGTPVADALTSGFRHALFAGAVFLVAAAVSGLRTTTTKQA